MTYKIIKYWTFFIKAKHNGDHGSILGDRKAKEVCPSDLIKVAEQGHPVIFYYYVLYIFKLLKTKTINACETTIPHENLILS